MYSSTHSLTSALDGGEWSASCPGRFTPREKAPGTHWIGGWVDPRAVLDPAVKRKIPSTSRESRVLICGKASEYSVQHNFLRIVSSIHRAHASGTGICQLLKLYIHAFMAFCLGRETNLILQYYVKQHARELIILKVPMSQLYSIRGWFEIRS
jgi:hypothetical protein